MPRHALKVRKRHRATSRPDLPGPRRRDPGVVTNLTLDDLRKARSQLVGVGDLIGIGVVASYMGLRRMMKDGLFPPARRLPSGLLSWEGGQIVDWYDVLPRVGEQPAKTTHHADNPLDD